MQRRVIKILEERCNGCGLCAAACHEGAIGMVEGKARLLREDYCDGLGDCLPACPADAIRFEVREAPAYDHQAVLAAQGGGCPGAQPRVLSPAAAAAAAELPSALTHWPVQLKLAPVRAPYFQGARLLLAADCTAFAYGAFHRDFLQGQVLLIGCPKLDGVDYAEKLAEIFRQNDLRSVQVLRMEVPCCGGLEQAARRALAASGKDLPLTVQVLSTDGRAL